MRHELIELLARFQRDEIAITELHSGILTMLKIGLRKTFDEQEAKIFNNFFWCLDMFDSKLHPREGLFGKIRDAWGQVFRSEYRISESGIKEKGRELFELLRMKEGHPVQKTP